MKHLKFSALLLLMLPAATCFSQVPGYMGKRFYASYDLHVFPAFSNPTYTEQNLYDVKTVHGINYRHGVAIDYVISRTNAIGISAGYFRTRFTHITDTSTIFHPSVQCNTIGLNYTVFLKQKGSLAPLGTYVKLSLERIGYKVTTDLDTEPQTFPGRGLRSFSFTFGDQKIYYDKLIIDVGAQFGYVEGWFRLLPERDVQWDAQRRIFFHYAMNIHARIGYLIF